GTVTFLFTDVEGSTKLLHALGAEAYADALAEHRRILREAFSAHGGVEVDTQGDAFFIAFPTAPGAVEAARRATEQLAPSPIHVRMGLHTGTPLLAEEGYIGPDVHKGARIGAAGHGGQILVSSATAQLVDTDLHDLGLHRLKDLSAPERIFQVGTDQHPRLKTLHQTNLPIPATPFLGREAELEELAELVADPATRLVTLTGTGGTGKTRLALQAGANAAERFPDGVWWVPLAPLRDPALVSAETTRALGGTGEPAEAVGERRLLMVYDNFEHVLDAADLVATLLARCPNMVVVATSREPLRIGGEREFAVDPLLPAQAVELFITRAIAVRHDFTATDEIAEICARLDHLPLAIELAASRVKVLSSSALLERLEHRLPILAGGARDLPERQRTLRATIEWSHELLTENEQRLFASLAVFRGGCTLDAAESVVDADLDTIGSLVDKSLVRVRDDRFWMLETIREFATERLAVSGEADALRDRHAAHYLALAVEAEPHLFRDATAWAARLEAEHDNLRAALDRLERTDGMAHARLAGALWRFWYLRSHLTEGLARLRAVLAALSTGSPERAKALHGVSVMLLNLRDTDGARAAAEEALALETAQGNRWGMAYATMMLGNALSEDVRPDRDLETAWARLEESADLFAKLGDDHFELIARSNYAWIIDDLRGADEAKPVYERILKLARAHGNRRLEAGSLAQLGMIARDEDRLADASAMLRESVRLMHAEGSSHDTAIELGRLASIIVRMGDAEKAAILVGASRAIIEQLGAEPPWWVARRDPVTLGECADAIGSEATESAEVRGRRLLVSEAVELALDPSP
ncbi:MAG: adenylate/guanylate cyclase domain-containing protein, partial [Candidatus Limnocylindria bacterium]